MEPTREVRTTLVDLLERILDKGLVLDLDMVICVAGVPLIGVSLRAVLGSMRTMLRYGLLQNWDTQIRNWEGERQRKAVQIV